MHDDQLQQYISSSQQADEIYSDLLAREEERAQGAINRKKAELDTLIRLETTRAQGPRNASAIFGIGYAGCGNGWTEGKPRILYPKERKRPRVHLRELPFSKEVQRHAASLEECLVPVRFDIDFDRYKLRDTLTWNVHDNTVPADVFAEHLCEDYGLPLAGFARDIERSLKAQVTDYHPHRFPDARSESSENPQETASIYTATHDDDLRIPIKLDVTVGSCNLIDQFEWDINNPNNVPERYAEQFCSELSLSTEFCTAIAHAIREQSQMYTKSLFLAGYSFDGRGVLDTDLRQMILPPIFSTLRPKHQMDLFAPIVSDLDSEQLARIERDREREGRRNRRQTRGKRGAILPDLSDLPKTYRTFYANAVLVPANEQVNSQDIGGSNLISAGIEDSSNDEDEFTLDEEDDVRPDRASRATRAVRHPISSYSTMKNEITTPKNSYGLMQGAIENTHPRNTMNFDNTRASINQSGQSITNPLSYPSYGVQRMKHRHDVSIGHPEANVQEPRTQSNFESPAPSCLVTLKISKEKLLSLEGRHSFFNAQSASGHSAWLNQSGPSQWPS